MIPTNLFTPFNDGKIDLRNRIVMSPMTRSRSPGGVPNGGNVEYYRRRAAEGVGLIVTEGTYIDHPGAPKYPDVPHMFGEAALAGWRLVVDAVHRSGTMIVPQLWHVGNVHRLGDLPDPSLPGYGPSAILEDGRLVVKEASEADLGGIAQSYARAAVAARDAGFDGVAIHGGHEYLLDQFFWSSTNRRQDGYGGSLVNRCRLASEVVAAIRAAVGPRFPIVFRFSQWKATDYDARIAETPRELDLILGRLVDAGVDVFDVSARRFYLPAFADSSRSLAAWTKHLSGKTTMAVGSVGLDQPHQSYVFRTADNVAAAVSDLRAVEEGLERGDFDLVGVGRALLADAHWVEKVRRGAFQEINPYTRAAMDNYN